MADAIVMQAPAKVNLHLGVGDVRPDGYHEVTTVLQALTLADEVTIAPAGALSVACTPDLGIPQEENLAYKAAAAFGAACGMQPAVAISISKRVPASAGLGGGSSDAAAVIRGLARMWGIAGDDPRLAQAAASIGADVPFFLGAPAALMSGRGDTLVRELKAPIFHVLVVWPRVPVPTVEAYKAFDAARPEADKGPDKLIEYLEGGDWRQVGSKLHNDMRAASVSLVPVIGEVTALLEAQAEVVGVEMCGSGSAVFAVFPTEEAAKEAAEAARGKGWWAAPAQTVGGYQVVGWNELRGSDSAYEETYGEQPLDPYAQGGAAQ